MPQIDYADPLTAGSGLGMAGFSLKSFLKVAAPVVAAVAPVAGGVVGSIIPGAGTIVGGIIGSAVGNLATGLIPGGGAPVGPVAPSADMDVAAALGKPGDPAYATPAGARVWAVNPASPYHPPASMTATKAPDGAAIYAAAPGLTFDETTLPPGTRIVRTAAGSVIYFVAAPTPAATYPASAGVPGKMDTGTVMLLAGIAVALLLARRS